jgi:hypothetical protein
MIVPYGWLCPRATQLCQMGVCLRACIRLKNLDLPAPDEQSGRRRSSAGSTLALGHGPMMSTSRRGAPSVLGNALRPEQMPCAPSAAPNSCSPFLYVVWWDMRGLTATVGGIYIDLATASSRRTPRRLSHMVRRLREMRSTPPPADAVAAWTASAAREKSRPGMSPAASRNSTAGGRPWNARAARFL